VYNTKRMMRRVGTYKVLGNAWWLVNPFHKKTPLGEMEGMPVFQSHSKFCADIEKLVADINNPKIRLVCIKSAMGTGKTFCMIKALGKMIIDNPNLFVINTTFRVSLAEYLQKEYEALGFKNYKDKDSVLTHKIRNDIKRIILQLDSFNRLDWKKVKPDMVIIDEISQQRRHLGSKTYLERLTRNMNNAKFEWSVRTAKKVIIMDAGLTHADISWIKRIMNSHDDKPITTVIHWNTFKPMSKASTPAGLVKGADIETTDNQFVVLNAIKTALSGGLKCFLATNIGKMKVMAIGTFLRKSFPDKKILVICSLTQNSPAVKRALADPNGEFGKYDAVVCSPSLQSGVSYKHQDFDECFGIFDNRTTMSSDALQQLRRVRKFKNSKYLVSLNQSNTRPFKDVGRMVDETKILWKHLYFKCEALTQYCGITCDDDGFNMITSNEFMRQILRNCEEQDYDRINFVRNFTVHAWAEGFTVRKLESGMTSAEEKALTVALSKALKVCGEENQDAINEAMVNAELVSNEVKTELKKRMETGLLTESEKVQFDKKVLNEYYNVEVETNKEWTDTYNVQKVKTHFTNQKKMAKIATMEDSLVDLKRYEKNFVEKNRTDETGQTAEGMRMLSYKPKYQIFNFIYVAMLKVFGFSGLWDLSTKTEDEVKTSAQLFKNTYLNEEQLKNTVLLCNKKIWKVQKIKTHKAIMEFINGVLRAEFGVSIGKTTRGGNIGGMYTLNNKYITDKMFINKWLVPDEADETIPAYGGLTVFVEANEEVEEVVEVEAEEAEEVKVDCCGECCGECWCEQRKAVNFIRNVDTFIDELKQKTEEAEKADAELFTSEEVATMMT
jgi:hypothetical protein